MKKTFLALPLMLGLSSAASVYAAALPQTVRIGTDATYAPFSSKDAKGGLLLASISISAQHMDGSEMTKLVGWAQSVVTFHGGASAHLDGVALIFHLPSGAGNDAVRGVPLLAPGLYLERACGISDA